MQSETLERRQFWENQLVPVVKHLWQNHISGADTEIQRRGTGAVLPQRSFEYKVLGNGIFGILMPSECVIMSRVCALF